MRRIPLSKTYLIGEQFEVDPELAKHLLKVLRLKDGDQIEASDGYGNIYLVKILFSKKNLQFLILSKECSSEIPLKTSVFIAELKPNSMEEAISIIAEHGANQIIPFLSKHSNSLSKGPISFEKLSRRKKIVFESTKKVGGTFNTSISDPIKFDEIINYCDTMTTKIVFWEKDLSARETLEDLNFSTNHAIVIGPEGGFSEKEIETFRKWNFMIANLGSRILRSPQAAASALSLIRYFTENNSL